MAAALEAEALLRMEVDEKTKQIKEAYNSGYQAQGPSG